MSELKFFRTCVSPNRNYATVERIPDSYVELPHSFSDFEIKELRTLVEEHCADVTIKFLGSYTEKPDAVYPEPSQVFHENTKYTLCIQPEIYLLPDKLVQRLEGLAFIESSVADFITNLCTPRF